MPLKQVMKGIPSNNLVAEGIYENDLEALNPCQHECVTRIGMTIQVEQESYLTMHPEIKAMLSSFVSKMVHLSKRKGILKDAAEYFTRPFEVLDKEVRDRLDVAPDGSYIQNDKSVFMYKDEDIVDDLKKIYEKYFPTKPLQTPESSVSITNTVSSSFLSIITSATTIPTPEPVPTPEPTLSETLFSLVSTTVDKAIFSHYNDEMVRYDTAYVELSRAVEEAMEIPVIEIRMDIAELFANAYAMFELDIMGKEKIAAERAWEKRMRKKLKRTLRRMNNFKGYETPPPPKSEPSSHESYKIPPPRPCICHPQFKYNRYSKDRFGIYLPLDTSEYSDFNVTVTPAISVESLVDEETDKIDRKSIMSRKTAKSTLSNISKIKKNIVKLRNDERRESERRKWNESVSQTKRGNILRHEIRPGNQMSQNRPWMHRPRPAGRIPVARRQQK
ncbi:uncharacterized protein [Battus philenor]|uniref:uncharacterized protein n=1 Tax=Battus philenor TaxID=42288 RepID=UPI0035D112B1